MTTTTQQPQQTMTLPLPDQQALAHSRRLLNHISHEIAGSGGQISFARYMRLALYAPGLGYYSAGKCKFGKGGDFVTAPEISPLFSQCLANQCEQVLNQVPLGHIIEFGPGSGILAAELLMALANKNCLPERYLMLEVSASLREQQRQTLQARCPDLLERVHWLDRLPAEPVSGVVLANEVLDAMPVHRFRLIGSSPQTIQEYYVTYANEQLGWRLGKASPELRNAITTLQQQQLLPCTKAKEYISEGYSSEINLLLKPWLNTVAHLLKQGALFIFDYGFPTQEYYHPDRSDGTLMCHYHHRSHSDPLILTGLQDITAHVDFGTAARYASALQFTIAGFVNQATFLLNNGLDDLFIKLDEKERYAASQQVKLLTLPSEMGELVKVLGLTRGLDLNVALNGFSSLDRSDRLFLNE